MGNVLNYCLNKVELAGHGLWSLYKILEFNHKIVCRFEQLWILYMYTTYISQIYTTQYEESLTLKISANLINYRFYICILHVYCTVQKKEFNPKIVY